MLPERRHPSASLRFAGRRYPPFELETSSGLWLPDGEVLPVKAEGVTKPYAQHQKFYVQMALPALWWKEHGQDSIPVEHLYSEALHELAHPRQMTSAMQQISALRARYHFPNGLNDDIIERTFGGNDEYRKLYEQEKAQLMQAVMAPDRES